MNHDRIYHKHISKDRSTIANVLGVHSKGPLPIFSGAHIIGSCLGLWWKLTEDVMPWLKSVYDLGMSHWQPHLSWQHVLSNESPLNDSRDLAIFDILPTVRMARNQELVHMDKVFLLSVATRPSQDVHLLGRRRSASSASSSSACSTTASSKSKSSLHALSGTMWLLRRFTRRMAKHALYDGFDSAHWEHNDGIVNTYSMLFPRVFQTTTTPSTLTTASTQPQASILDASATTASSEYHISIHSDQWNDEKHEVTSLPTSSRSSIIYQSSTNTICAARKGQWYTYVAEKNHFCGTYWDRDAKQLYANVFRMVNAYTKNHHHHHHTTT
jgi:hypothetical protein